MRLTILFIGAAAVLSGCVSVLPEPKAPEALYRISATGPSLPLSATVLVREPEAPQIMAGRTLVREDSLGAMRLLPNVEWAGRATRLMQLAIVDSFDGGSGSALLPESSASAEYELAVRLTTLGFEGDEAVCSGAAKLIRSVDRSVVAEDRVVIKRPAVKPDALILKATSEACVAEFASFVSKSVE